jgi:hypothetical protein
VKRIIRKSFAVLATAVFAVVTLVTPAVADATTSQPRDNDANAIVWGGAYTKGEFIDKVRNGDGHNSAANIQEILFRQNRNITESTFSSSSTVNGTVYKDGRVTVGNKTVATGATSVGRHNLPGSTKDGSVYSRPVSVSFAAQSIPAWVYMEKGVFKYAILKSCGNPVKAKPAPAPKTPTPAPKTPAPKTPTPAPKTPTPQPEQPGFACVSLTPSQPNPTNEPNKFRFTVTPRVTNTTITGYRFTFSDNSAPVETAANQPYVERTVASSLTVQAYVKTTHGTSAPTEACSATATVTVSPTPTSGGGQVLGATLPATGPEAALGGIAGLSAIGWAGRSYLRSRKSLLSSMRNNRPTRQ